MIKIANLPYYGRQVLNWTVTVGSVILCALILPSRLPGMELLGLGPDWLLIWVVAWSVKRSLWQGAIAGLALGLLQDGMTAPSPSHTISLMCVGVLTAMLKKQRYIQEDFISVALIVFGMTVVAETVLTLQFSELGDRSLAEIWTEHQIFTLSAAILSSMWAPVVYYPLNLWWQKMSWLENNV